MSHHRGQSLQSALVAVVSLLVVASKSIAGSDVIIGALPDVRSYGSATVNGTAIGAYAFGSTWCNLGSTTIDSLAQTNRHPLFASSVFRIRDGRIEQIGIGWMFYAYCALQQSLCSTCQPTGSGCTSTLGVGCSDPYDSFRTGAQTDNGPRSRVNASTGDFPGDTVTEEGTWPPIPTGQSVIARRVQVRLDDLNPSTNPASVYFAESIVISPQDAIALNANNNASCRKFTVGALTSGTYSLALAGSTIQGQPAILRWPQFSPGAQVSAIDAPDGRLYVGHQVIELGDGRYRYEYAIYNLNSDSSAAKFTVQFAPGSVITNPSFRDVNYHSGEIYDGADWIVSNSNNSITWECRETYQQRPLANALRWGTMYNFSFESTDPPLESGASISSFKSTWALQASVRAPGSPCYVPSGSVYDCNQNGVRDSCDIAGGASDCNANAILDSCELAAGTALDCNTNTILDSCDIAGGTSDCNANTIPDSCELAAGTALDCNTNTIPDSCDIASGASNDVDSNGIPDECKTDCNGNGLPDAWEISQGTATDCNLNAIPDACENDSRTARTGNMGAFGAGVTCVGALTGCVPSTTPVSLRLDLIGDLSATTEYATLKLGGVTVGSLLFQTTGNDCPTTPDSVLIPITAAQWNSLLASATTSGVIAVEVLGSPLVSATQCANSSSVLTVQYGGPRYDCDSNAVSDLCQIVAGAADCNHNARLDACEIQEGSVPDVDQDGTIDSCQLDCNNNQLPDSWEISQGTVPDCNTNGVPDACDIAANTVPDCNTNGVPDSCDIAANTVPDCNVNGVPDACDIAANTVPDCNTNGVPDSCDIAANTVPDCNVNGVPDSCDIATNTVPDCNTNGVPDSCDIASGPSNDVDSNGIPDECKTDCNGNGLPDAWEISQGTAPDCNVNSVPDSCDLTSGAATDCNTNGVPDSCDIASGATDKDANGQPDDCQYAYGDFDLSGDIGGADLGFLLAVWGTNSAIGDLDGDHTIGGGDLAVLLSRWGLVQ